MLVADLKVVMVDNLNSESEVKLVPGMSALFVNMPRLESM